MLSISYRLNVLTPRWISKLSASTRVPTIFSHSKASHKFRSNMVANSSEKLQGFGLHKTNQPTEHLIHSKWTFNAEF